jgi:hypothetical protein
LYWIYCHCPAAFPRQPDSHYYTHHHSDPDFDIDSHTSNADRDGDQYIHTHPHALDNAYADPYIHPVSACHVNSFLDINSLSYSFDYPVLDAEPDAHAFHHLIPCFHDPFEYLCSRHNDTIT